MSYRQLGATVRDLFCTYTLATGALVNADALPTGTVYKNGVSNALAVTVTNKGTGVYEFAYTPTTVDGFASGDVVYCKALATVGAVASGGALPSYVMQAYDIDDTLGDLSSDVSDLLKRLNFILVAELGKL
ncbi:MAG: hypothetical protein WC505_07195 [Patescibacteria group bacterium]